MIAKNATESLEIFGHVSLMTLDSLMKCAFSCQTNGQTHGLIFSKLDKQMSTLFFLVLSISIWVKAFLSLALSISELGCYIKAISELTFRVYQRIRNPWFRSDLIYQHSSAGRHFKEACRMAHQHTGIAPLFLSSPFSSITMEEINGIISLSRSLYKKQKPKSYSGLWRIRSIILY